MSKDPGASPDQNRAGSRSAAQHPSLISISLQASGHIGDTK